MALLNLIRVVEKACKDSTFKVRLEISLEEAVREFGLTEEEKQAIRQWVEEEVLV